MHQQYHAGQTTRADGKLNLVKASKQAGLLVANMFLCALLGAMPVANAAPVTHRTTFNVKFGLITVGKADFTYRLDTNSYKLTGNGKTAGLANMFAPSSGKLESLGIINGNRIIAESHNAVVVDAKKRQTLAMSFFNGTVKQVKQVPDRRTRRQNAKKYIPVSAKHMASVIDPVSSLVIPVDENRISDGKAVCNRTTPIYDGETRYDIKMTYKTTKPVSTKGYSGYAHVCAMRYVPIAGHRKKQRNVEYMRKNKNIEIWLAPMAETRIFSPIRIEVGTWVGKFSAEPVFFGKS